VNRPLGIQDDSLSEIGLQEGELNRGSDQVVSKVGAGIAQFVSKVGSGTFQVVSTVGNDGANTPQSAGSGMGHVANGWFETSGKVVDQDGHSVGDERPNNGDGKDDNGQSDSGGIVQPVSIDKSGGIDHVSEGEPVDNAGLVSQAGHSLGGEGPND
jgi:hypothetical protein